MTIREGQELEIPAISGDEQIWQINAVKDSETEERKRDITGKTAEIWIRSIVRILCQY